MATAHVIGAGISGLAAATALAEAHLPIKLYEATAHAGGRCRSTNDATFGALDSGLHLINGRDHETFRYLDRISARDRLASVQPPRFPAASMTDYAALTYGMVFPDAFPLSHFMAEENPLYDEWARNFSRLRLHTPPETVSARAVRSALLDQRGELYMAARTLADTFLEPALKFLDYCGGSAYFGHALNGFTRAGEKITTLNFARKKVVLAENDVIILATPPSFACSLLPDVSIPLSTHSAITITFAATHRESVGTLRFIHDGPCDLLRYDKNIIRVAIRVADSAWYGDQALLTDRIWKYLIKLHPYLQGEPLGKWAVGREKRAGHRCDMATMALPKTNPHPHPQCILAGDWLDPSRPASVESAALSGHQAAELAKKLVGKFAERRQ